MIRYEVRTAVLDKFEAALRWALMLDLRKGSTTYAEGNIKTTWTGAYAEHWAECFSTFFCPTHPPILHLWQSFTMIGPCQTTLECRRSPENLPSGMFDLRCKCMSTQQVENRRF